MVKATLMQVKNFFEETSVPQFMKEWKELDKDEQEWFKEAVGEQVTE